MALCVNTKEAKEQIPYGRSFTMSETEKFSGRGWCANETEEVSLINFCEVIKRTQKIAATKLDAGRLGKKIYEVVM